MSLTSRAAVCSMLSGSSESKECMEKAATGDELKDTRNVVIMYDNVVGTISNKI